MLLFGILEFDKKREQNNATVIYEDNQLDIILAKNPPLNSWTKHQHPMLLH